MTVCDLITLTGLKRYDPPKPGPCLRRVALAKPRCRGWRGRQSLPLPVPLTVRPAPSPVRPRAAFRVARTAQGPYGAFEMQLAGCGFLDHAVEVAARRGPEMLRLLGRDDRQRDRGQLPAHRQAGFTP